MVSRRRPPASLLVALKALHTACPACIVPQCRRPTCALVFPAGRFVCIDCDICRALEENARKPDFIVLYLPTGPAVRWWFVVEMKSRVQHPRDIVAQLQAGASAIEAQPQFAIAQSPQRLVPLILRTGSLRVADLQIINRSRVSFLGKPRVIESARCGVVLGALIE